MKVNMEKVELAGEVGELSCRWDWDRNASETSSEKHSEKNISVTFETSSEKHSEKNISVTFELNIH